MREFSDSIQSTIVFEESEQLVLRLKEGEEAAFSEVFHLYKDMVYTLCCKLLSDKGEALDVTQEVFMILLRKIAGFRGECSLKTWLYRVTVNQAANRNRWWRRRGRSQTLSLGIPLEGTNGTIVELPDASRTPEQLLCSSELQAALQQGLRSLPFDQRVALALREVEGLTYEEIAEVTGTHIGTVKSRIARGRERLRVFLTKSAKGIVP